MSESSDCPFCQKLPGLRSGANPDLIVELEESVVILAETQGYPGWCIVVLKEHVEHLGELPIATQERLFGEVARVASAIWVACEPRRLNYECLGNEVAHVHWHIVPRYPDDPQPGGPIWVRPPAERAGSMTAAGRAELVERLRSVLT